MKKFGISRRKGNQPKLFAHDELHELYVMKRMSTHQIATMKSCAHATIRSCLRRVGIKLRKRDESLFGRKIKLTERFLGSIRKNQSQRWAYLRDNPPFTEENLRELYIEKGLGTHEIAKIKNMSHIRVLSWMKRFDIKSRSRSEAQKKYIQSHPERLRQMVLILRRGSKHPNKLEEKFCQLLARHNFPFKYCGNGSVLIGGYCPDFVATDGSCRIIEIFGMYWHKPEDEEKRKKIFVDMGYKVLIIWEVEFKYEENLLRKLKCWIEG